MANEAARLVERGITRGAAIAVVVIVVVWHGSNDLLATALSRADYRWPVLVTAAWFAFAVLGGYAAVRLLRHDGQFRYPWLAAGGLLVIAVGVDLASRDQLLTAANWGWGAVGWPALIIFWHRPARDLVVFLAINAAACLVILVPDAEFDRVGLSRYLMIVVGTGTLQLGYAGSVRALRATADWAARAGAAVARTATMRAAAEQLHVARWQRYEALRHGAATVLTELAGGADPADSVRRHRSAVEAARLRRLVVETDDISDPLVHELRACADIAERKGVMVDLVAAGRLGDLPIPVRRALAEAPIAVLTAAQTQARITVTASDRLVAVSVLADADLDDDELIGIRVTGDPAVTVEALRDGDLLWIQASIPIPAHDPD